MLWNFLLIEKYLFLLRIIWVLMSIEKNNIIVIGAGIGGLSAAAILSFAGFNVTILEQNKDVDGTVRPGGGMPLAAKSGIDTAKMILKDES